MDFDDYLGCRITCANEMGASTYSDSDEWVIMGRAA
jgi:hypothetical protein